MGGFLNIRMKRNNIIKIIILMIFVCLLGIRFLNGRSNKDKSLSKGSNNVTMSTSSNSASGKTKNDEGKKSSNVSKASGNRKYNIDYDHIIGGDVSSNGERVTGGHTLLKGDVRIVKKIGRPSKSGVYKANVEIRKHNGTWQRKTSNGGINTMFPEDWDEARVIEEINSAWENRKDLKGRDNMWQGLSKSGVIIRGYKKPRITAYPVFEGDR